MSHKTREYFSYDLYYHCRSFPSPSITLIIISLSMHAVIGQFSGPYSPVWTAKILFWFSCKTVL